MLLRFTKRFLLHHVASVAPRSNLSGVWQPSFLFILVRMSFTVASLESGGAIRQILGSCFCFSA